MSRIKKFGLLAIALILTLCIMAGCSGSGAVIKTAMKVNKDFSGKRTISVFVPKSSLDEYVEGGLKALKSTANSKMPKQMTLATKSQSDGATLTFTVNFSSLDDYNAKVKKIIAAGSNEKLVPEISYENLDTYFKKGVYFKENFTSFDLLQWYFDALEKADIISYSSSSWYSMGDTAITIAGKKYETGSTMSVDKRELCCLDGIDVETFINYDGSYKRVFVFKTNENTIKTLADKGCVLKDYLSGMVAEGDTFEDTTEDTNYSYTITVNAKDAEELIKKTDAILQTKNSLALTTEIEKENLGMAKLTFTEKLDGSYYLNYDYGRPLQSKVHMYDNVTLAKDESGTSANLSDDVLSYSPFAANENKFEFDWKISFETVEIVTGIKNAQNLTVDFVFTAAEEMSDELKNAAIDALEKNCGEVGDFSKDKNSCTISFAGTNQDVTNKINNFIGFSDSDTAEDKTYFTIEFDEAETASKLTNAYSGEIFYDLTPVIGNTRVQFNDSESLLNDYYYQGGFTTDENGNRTAASSDTVTFTLVKVSLLFVILLGVFIVFFVAGVVIAFLKRKAIIDFFKGLKRKEKPAATASVSDEAEAPAQEIADNEAGEEDAAEFAEEEPEVVEVPAVEPEEIQEVVFEAEEPAEAEELAATAKDDSETADNEETEEFI